MERMKWSALLSQQRLRPEEEERTDLRSGFERDYHRIIGSSSFRRLQDKTQVFPLDSSDFIRTRLTHSLEVSSIGRSLAGNVAEALLDTGADPEFLPEMKLPMTEVLECAGLIHDIGNPPFGHFGEETLREWFEQHLGELTFGGEKVTEILTEEERCDLVRFEGNAQGLRLVSALHFPGIRGDMNLTAAVLSAALKYPVSSTEASSCAKDAARKKPGFFASEKDHVRRVAEITGTGARRNPLAYLLEAADDIAYATADISDAYKKGFFRYPAFLRLMRERGAGEREMELLEALCAEAEANEELRPEEYAMRRWLACMQDFLIRGATERFLSEYERIMNGTFPEELLSAGEEGKLLTALKRTAYDTAFVSRSIFKTEIAAHTMMTFLLDHLVPAALSYDTGCRPGLMEEKFLEMIPADYRQVYARQTKGLPSRERTAARIRMVTDSVSAMTDTYARDLYRELNGMPFA